MGIFRSLYGKREPTPLPVRDTLFGDLPMDRWPEGAAESFPWSTFAAARTDVAQGGTTAAVGHWREILGHAGLESRHYLQAWDFLRQHGQHPPPEVATQVV